MSVTLVNLTLPFVTEEIDTILLTYPHYPYQKAFANTEMRQRLIAYVLSRVPNQYTVSKNGETPIVPPKWIYPSSVLQLQIEHFIHQGIQDLLTEDAESSMENISTVHSTYAASNRLR